MVSRSRATCFVIATIRLAAVLVCAPDDARDVAIINVIQQNINALQAQLRQLCQQMAQRDAALAAARHGAAEAHAEAAAASAKVTAQAANPPTTARVVAQAARPSPPPTPGEFHFESVTVRLGGCIEFAYILGHKNDISDIASNFSAIPLADSAQNHKSEVRETARRSRISMLASGKADDVATVSGYAERDLQGAAPTANPGGAGAGGLAACLARQQVRQ
jgi:hypothetical protein